jgi:CBS-domain-containing membrane protein
MERDAAAEAVTVAEIMTTEVVTTTPDRPVEEVARELRARGFGGLPVVDAAGILVGVVSEFDVISKRGRTVAEIMTRGAISVGDETGAEQVTALMGLHGIRRVPVVRDGRLVGIVSRSDLLRLFTFVRWTCPTCGTYERGFSRPEHCVRCAGTEFYLEREGRTPGGF